jgi:hypothetical protein
MMRYDVCGKGPYYKYFSVIIAVSEVMSSSISIPLTATRCGESLRFVGTQPDKFGAFWNSYDDNVTINKSDVPAMVDRSAEFLYWF